MLERLQADARYRAFAAAFPPFRPIARRRARAVFDLCAGFVYAQTLLAIVSLDVPALLLEAPRSAAVLAPLLGLPAERAERLLLAGVALRLLRRRRDGCFALGPLGAALIGNAGVSAMIAHHGLFYDDLRDPVALLRAGEGALAEFWRYDGAETQSAPYTALMRASQPMIAAEIIAAVRLRRYRRLLDVGGGSGAFVQAVLRHAPDLHAAVFDLPPVAAEARRALAAAGLAHRTDVVGGDFARDPLPEGFDLVSLVRVLHDHDDAAALRLLRRIHDSLPMGGTLLLAEPMAEAPGAAPVGNAYFGWYLLAMGRGRPRTAREIAAMMRVAGFRCVRARSTRLPLLTGVITGRRY